MEMLQHIFLPEKFQLLSFWEETMEVFRIWIAVYYIHLYEVNTHIQEKYAYTVMFLYLDFG